jgi:LPS sulfotransferase NodH
VTGCRIDAEDPVFAADRLDQPPYEGRRSYYLICSTPRTGSNVLCELLRLNGAGVPMEYFHRRKYMPLLAKRYGLASTRGENKEFTFEQYIEALKRHRTSPNGYFGIKVHWSQYEWVDRACELEDLLPELAYVLITREDELAQAVSASKAAYSRQWHSGQEQQTEYRYDEEHIKGCLGLFRKHNRKWRQLFESRGIRPLHVTYERLVSSTRDVVEELLDFLKVPYRNIQSDLDDLTIKRQFDAINQDWIDRYKKTHRDEF